MNLKGTQENWSKEEIRQCVKEVCQTLEHYGYDPGRQLAGYVLTNDPIYITAKEEARVKMQNLDHFLLLEAILQQYVEGIDGMSRFDTKKFQVD